MVQPSLAPVNTGSGIVYTCASNVSTATCNYLNTTVAGYYNDTFTNANASIYVMYGNTGLGQSTYYFNFVTYSQYKSALDGIASPSSIQTSAQTALSNYDGAPYGSDSVMIQPALAEALGIEGQINGGAAGTDALGSFCSLPAAGCYNAIITLTNVPNTFYYDDQGGTEPLDEYDFYATVSHETDEVLGTVSCIDTQSSNLKDGCDSSSGDTGTPSAVDLFRYSSAGNLVLNSSLSTTAGAYFSYDGGTTNGMKGVGGSPKYYNTLSNGNDYADYVSSSPDCGTNQAIQDGEGCPGEDAGLTILNDGGSEVNILTALGYGVPSATNTPAALTSPAPNAVFTGYPVAFTWGSVTGATDYSIRLGTTAGGYDLYASGRIGGTSATISNLPTNGETIYARLYTYYGSKAVYNDYTFTSATAAALTSPAANSALDNYQETFTWGTVAGATAYSIRLGTTVGGYDLYASGEIGGTSATIYYLPMNGETIYARVYTFFGSNAVYNDYPFTAGDATALTFPANHATLTATQRFTWGAVAGATQYSIRLGTTVGGYDVWASGRFGGTSVTALNLPTNGETIYARLYTYFGSSTVYYDYVFTAPAGPVTSPAPSLTLSK